MEELGHGMMVRAASAKDAMKAAPSKVSAIGAAAKEKLAAGADRLKGKKKRGEASAKKPPPPLPVSNAELYEGALPEVVPTSPISSAQSETSHAYPVVQRIHSGVATALASAVNAGRGTKNQSNKQIVLQIGNYYETLNTSTLRAEASITSSEVAGVAPYTRVLLIARDVTRRRSGEMVHRAQVHVDGTQVVGWLSVSTSKGQALLRQLQDTATPQQMHNAYSFAKGISTKTINERANVLPGGRSRESEEEEGFEGDGEDEESSEEEEGGRQADEELYVSGQCTYAAHPPEGSLMRERKSLEVNTSGNQGQRVGSNPSLSAVGETKTQRRKMDGTDPGVADIRCQPVAPKMPREANTYLIGDHIEVFSNSCQTWLYGMVESLSANGHSVNVCFQFPASHKDAGQWAAKSLPRTSPNLRFERAATEPEDGASDGGSDADRSARHEELGEGANTSQRDENRAPEVVAPVQEMFMIPEAAAVPSTKGQVDSSTDRVMTNQVLCPQLPPQESTCQSKPLKAPAVEAKASGDKGGSCFCGIFGSKKSAKRSV